MPKFDRKKAVAYAKKFSLKDNPAFPRYGAAKLDCTSFVGQCMLAGGWFMEKPNTHIQSISKLSPGVWYYFLDKGKVVASWTWGGADNFHSYLTLSHRASEITDPYEMEPGDIIQLDTGGKMTHTMIVSEVTGKQIKRCQHSTEKKDALFDPTKYPDAVYWKIRNSFFPKWVYGYK